MCARKEIWKNLLQRNLPDGWGIDVWILIETAMLGYQIKELYLGRKEHTHLSHFALGVPRTRLFIFILSVLIVK